MGSRDNARPTEQPTGVIAVDKTSDAGDRPDSEGHMRDGAVGLGACTLHPPGWIPGQKENLGPTRTMILLAIDAPRCCDVCQKFSNRKATHAPMVQLFSRVTMDIVVPCLGDSQRIGFTPSIEIETHYTVAGSLSGAESGGQC